MSSLPPGYSVVGTGRRGRSDRRCGERSLLRCGLHQPKGYSDPQRPEGSGRGRRTQANRQRLYSVPWPLETQKRGVRFSDAEMVLFDSNALTREDMIADCEQRFVTVAMDTLLSVLVLVYTYLHLKDNCIQSSHKGAQDYTTS